MTDLTDLLVIILALDISFMAKGCAFRLRSTFHTFPNPPLPMQWWYTKLLFETADGLVIKITFDFFGVEAACGEVGIAHSN
jgi:hypothetical protein